MSHRRAQLPDRLPSSTTASILLVLVILVSAPLLSQEESSAQPGEQATAEITIREDLTTRLADVEQRLSASRQRLEELGADDPTEPTAVAAIPLRAEVELLESLRLFLIDQRAARQRTEELTEERQQLDEELAQGPAATYGDTPPYTLTTLDDALDRRDAIAASQVSLEDAVELLRDELGAAAEQRDRAARQRRQLQEELESTEASEGSAELRGRLARVRLEEETAAEETHLIELQLANDQLALDLNTARQTHLTEAVAWLRARVEPTEEDRRDALFRFEEHEEETRRTLESARRDLSSAEQRRAAVEERLALTDTVDPALNAQSEARRSGLAAARQQVDLLEDRLQRIEVLRQAWELRYAWLRGEIQDRAMLEDTRSSLAETVSDLERQLRRQQSLLDQARASLVGVEARLAELSSEDSGRRWLREERSNTGELVALHEEELSDLSRALAQARRPLAQIQEDLSEVPFRQRLEAWRGGLANVWSYELMVVQDSSITIGKVVVAILVVLFGFTVSKRLSRLLGRRVLQRFGLAEGAAAAIQTVVFYLLLLAFFLWALRLVNIPLTVFTVLGGALAIGVGFGSQNIVNNFMSGLILMVERPVKVGDLVEVEGIAGRVEQIGARSTRIRSGDNTHVVVPNSSILESSVLNWTLADNVIRTHMDIGVAYGSDVDLVVRQLKLALEHCERVLPQPAPEILFLDFGDSALLFRALFWTRVQAPMDKTRAESEVRFQVDRLFAEAKISIPFPQRDVHLDGLGPLEVRLHRPTDTPKNG